MNILEKYPKSVVAALVVVLVLILVSLNGSNDLPGFVKDDLKSIQKDMIWQAEQLAGVLEEGSGVVVLDLDYVMQAHGNRVYSRVFDALTDGGVSILHVEGLTPDEGQGWIPFQPGFPYFEFLRVAEEYPDADAVIALCGAPYFSGNSQWPDEAELPKLLVAEGVQAGSAEMLYDEGLLYAATVPRTVKKNDKLTLSYELLSDRQD